MQKSKITPSLWFHSLDGKLSHILEYYRGIFNENIEIQHITSLGKTPSGNTELCTIKLFGIEYLFMSTEIEHQSFNDVFSIILKCNNQTEIDNYWDYFTLEGKESMCGWCIDKFGLRWQIIPEQLNELMAKPNATEVMMKQTKIIIQEYL